MYTYKAYSENPIEVGINTRPYTCEYSLASANAMMAVDIVASNTLMCIQSRKVRSLAKYTLGSTLIGTTLSLFTRDPTPPIGKEPLMPNILAKPLKNDMTPLIG